MSEVLHSAPRYATSQAMLDELAAAIGGDLVSAQYAHGEMHFRVQRGRIDTVLQHLRDEHGYQQLMDIAGVDYPSRPERFDVVYMLLSVTKNRRVAVKVSTDEDTPVPTVTTLWPNAGWLEREVFDMFGVVFSGNTDLRRILTDYGFEGHPFRKDFPLTGYVELRYSEEDRRVVYEPVKLAQDFRAFDFLSPWEGANYPLPGDEKAAMPPVKDVTTTDKPEETGAGLKADQKATENVAPSGLTTTNSSHGEGQPVPVTTNIPDPGAPEPTEDRPDRAPRVGSTVDTAPATKPDDAAGDRKDT
jgi:NADH-quinone oxidoreductase subunit C